jgi:hypothetical protein
VLSHLHVSLETRKHVVQTSVQSVMCYGREMWSINKRTQPIGGSGNVVSDEVGEGAVDHKSFE